jgi:hypothetical protein
MFRPTLVVVADIDTLADYTGGVNRVLHRLAIESRFLCALAAGMLMFASCSPELPPHVQDVVDNGARFESSDGKAFAIPVPYSEVVGADDTGVFVRTGLSRFYVSIPNLVGVGYATWSPKRRYLLIDNGTYAVRSLICVDLKARQVVGSVPIVGDSYAWVDSDMIVTTTQDGYRVPQMVPTIGVYLYRLTPSGVESSPVFPARELSDFELQTKEGDMLVIRQTDFENTGTESPWTRYQKIGESEFSQSADDLIRIW